MEWPSELPLYYSWCHQCHQNAFLSIFSLPSGTEKKSLGARSGEQAGCSNTVICLVAKNSSLLLFFGELIWDYFAHTFLMSRSSVEIFLTVFLSIFACSAMLLTVSRRFSRTIWRNLQCFLQFCLLLAVLISLRQWHFVFPQKNVSPTCKLLFSS